MYNYHTLINDFLQFKRFLNYKYKTDEIVLKQIENFLIKNNVIIITKEVTEKYARINSNLNSNTIARNMNTFREFCYYLKNQRNIECYQIPKKIYPQNHNDYTPYIFSHNEIKRIYSNLYYVNSNYLYSYYKRNAYPLIIKILYQTGMRIGEVLNLKVKNYNYELGIFTLEETKNTETRNVALPESLNEIINNFIIKFTKNKEDLVFKCSQSAVGYYFQNVLRLSNIKITDKGPTLHSLRHSFITHNIELIIKNKQDFNSFVPILAAQVGHTSLSSLSYYYHITNDILNEVNDISNKELGYLIEGGDLYEE